MKIDKIAQYNNKIFKIASRIKKIKNKNINFSVIFDSLEMLEFIEQLENEFKIKIGYKSINKFNFTSINNLSKEIEKIEKK